MSILFITTNQTKEKEIIMNTIKHLTIDTNAPDDYMVDILRSVRVAIHKGKYSGKGQVNRADMVVYYYSYIYSI